MHKKPIGEQKFKKTIKSDMRAEKSKTMNIYQQIRQKTYQNLLQIMEMDKQTAGNDEWKKSSIHQKPNEKKDTIDDLNYTWLYVEYLMHIINKEWTKKHTLYKNRNHWDEQILTLHRLKIQRMIVLEMVQYLQQTKISFLTDLASLNKN